MAEKTAIEQAEEKFRSLPKGTPESNQAFKEWREIANAPAPAAKKRAARKSTK